MDYVKRDLEQELKKYIESPEILAVVGPRQAGKTTLFRKLQEELENSNFVSFEDRETLRIFEENEKEFAKLHLEGHDYLLIDEFQYAEDGGKKLKYLYDSYPDKKILITGSSAAEMTIEGLKHLTGRVLKFRLYPFSFREFLRAEDQKLFEIFSEAEENLEDWIEGEELDISSVMIEKLERLRKEYAVYGGYPRVVLSDSEEEKEKVLENIVETYLIREIGEVLEISDDREFKDLMRVLALQMGEKTKYSSVRQKTGIKHQKLKERLNILEHTFVLEQLRPFYTNKQKEISKQPKIYFYDNGFRNALINSFNQLELRNDKGELNENFFFTQAKTELKYWRTKSRAEVDFVRQNHSLTAYEIKTVPKTTKSIKSFQKKYSPEKMLIMNQEGFERKEEEIYVPLAFSEEVSNI